MPKGQISERDVRAALKELKERGDTRFSLVLKSLDEQRTTAIKETSEFVGLSRKFSDIPAVSEVFKKLAEERSKTQQQLKDIAKEIEDKRWKLKNLNP